MSCTCLSPAPILRREGTKQDMLIAMQEADGVRMSVPLAGVVRELIKDFKVRMNYPTPKAPR